LNCNLCPLSLAAQVAGEGPTKPKLIVIGSHPTNEDERSHRPFTGGKDPRKEYANLIIKRACASGLKLDVANEVYLAYALRCNAKHRSKQVDIKPAWIKACHVANLGPELSKVHCPIILALGKEALLSLLPHAEGGTAANRGRWHEAVIGGHRRLIRVTFPLAQIERQSVWKVREDDDGQFHREKRWTAFGSIGYWFNKDLEAVKAKFAELGIVPDILRQKEAACEHPR
jgi:uracil-DNA glycosylase family 4